MARPLRLEFSGALYHVSARGNAQQGICITEDNRQEFLFLLQRACERYHWLCHAYCLMTNHYHLLIETQIPTLSSGKNISIKPLVFYRESFENRNRAMAEAYQSGHYTLSETGDEFGVSYATVSRAGKEYELNAEV